jgi:excinuclease ABC subunit B
MLFKLKSNFKPCGDQPKVIEEITNNIKNSQKEIQKNANSIKKVYKDKIIKEKLKLDSINKSFNTIVGVTGSGKTFVMANIIKNLNRPCIILAQNKTLAAQLYNEFKSFFPNNAVEYFISYYDYYQPESYIPNKDLFIEKELKINKEIEKLRLKATASLMSRRDVIIISSISCIYGLGNPENYENFAISLKVKDKINRNEFLLNLINLQYNRTEIDLIQGKFRIKGDVIDIFPSYMDNLIRVEFFDDEIESIKILDKVSLNLIEKIDQFKLFPAKHFVISGEELEKAISKIEIELDERKKEIDSIEAHRLSQRTKYDIEMIKELGYCNGIENYSVYFDERKRGEPPYCLLDFFDKDFIFFIDESHVTIPQIKGMYKGDFSRKKNLIDHGFRLPSAYDNRPLKFEEVEKYFKTTICVSATPSEYELKNSDKISELIIRPTGLIDPPLEIYPSKNQIDKLIEEINITIKKEFRTLVTTLTKRMAEDLTEYLSKAGIKVRYLHSDIDVIERSEILRQLRLGSFDVLVGINLLREGLDLPEVALVAILDADKEGFLRDTKSLIQISGRAARNTQSKVILFADKKTNSISNTIIEMNRRRKIQLEYNKKNKIIPKTIIKEIPDEITTLKSFKSYAKNEIPIIIDKLNIEMKEASQDLNFELAIQLRDQIEQLNKELSEKINPKKKKKAVKKKKIIN